MSPTKRRSEHRQPAHDRGGRNGALRLVDSRAAAYAAILPVRQPSCQPDAYVPKASLWQRGTKTAEVNTGSQPRMVRPVRSGSWTWYRLHIDHLPPRDRVATAPGAVPEALTFRTRETGICKFPHTCSLLLAPGAAAEIRVDSELCNPTFRRNEQIDYCWCYGWLPYFQLSERRDGLRSKLFGPRYL